MEEKKELKLPEDLFNIIEESGGKRRLTPRENELYELIRKKGLTVSKIIERCSPTPDEIAWMWEWDRKQLLQIKKQKRLNYI